MKKLLLFSILALAAIAAFAAFDFGAARAIPLLTSATSINAGATNTVAVAAAGLKGNAELFVTTNGNASRTALNISICATNTVDGGWFELAGRTITATNAGVYRVSFPAEYISSPAQVKINPVGAAASVTAFILSY